MPSKPYPAGVTKQVEKLRSELRHHEHLYYVLDSPRISDADYDRMMLELRILETAHPQLITPDSPTQRVGGKPKEGVQKVPHARPMLALDKAYHETDLLEWDSRR